MAESSIDALPDPDMPGERSRLGGLLCTGLPWMRLELHREPRGMLERPPRCQYPKACAAARCCLQAEGKERVAWLEHRRQYNYEFRTGRTEAESFEAWAGLDVAV